jgi:hypothetical protein
MTLDVETADTYFETHLKGAAWAALPELTKTAAITMAENDILSLIPAIDDENADIVAAVCEQALFLAQNFTAIDVFDANVSQSVEGFGSETKAPKTRVSHISPRAQMFVRKLFGGRVRLSN